MKKLLVLAGAVALLAMPSAQAREPGGIGAGLVGCCFGIRTAAAYNEGKSINIREWLQLIWVGHIWAAFEGYNGTTLSDLHNSEPAYF